METTKEQTQKKVIVFLGALCVLLAVTASVFAGAANRYRQREKLINEKAISSLCESLDSISVSLQKSVYTGDKEALEKIGNELCRQASSAKESLSLISLDGKLCDGVYKFLSQVGNFTLALSVGEESLSEEETAQLKMLFDYADGLSRGFNEICLDYYNGNVSLESAVNTLDSESNNLPESFQSRISDAAQTLTDYPTLIYDGPFADGQAQKKSALLAGKNEITAKEAAQKAAELLGIRAANLKQEENISSNIELYAFSVGGVDITVTQKGGYICSILSDAYALEQSISTQEAVSRGEHYLEKLGYKNMKSTYYSLYDGICTVNYAYYADGVICYPDLIKVSISLDTGKLVAFDAKVFLLNHTQRAFDKVLISREEASGKLSSALKIKDSRLAVIPLDTGKEALCYEFRCADSDNKEILIYIDAVTGEQKDVLLLLYSDGGVLTK